MSSSDAPTMSRLTISTGIPDAHTTVFDAWDHVVHEHLGRQSDVDLPSGLYTVRVERGGLLEETLVRHGAAQLIEPTVPGRYTPALIAGATTSHEYYTGPAVNFSSNMTAPDLDGGDYSGLFLFIRTSNDLLGQGRDVSEGLSLATPAGQVLRLDGDLSARDTNHGWMAFSAKAQPGTYYLRYEGEDSRAVPIHLSPNWQTQVFLTHRERPLFDSMRVFQGDLHQGFQPNDETTDAVDRALTDLQFGTRSISRNEMNHLLSGKFANPMLGLLAAHLLLRREKPNTDLLNTVIYNLNHLAGDSPDFAALCLRVHLRFPGEGLAPPPPAPFAVPPMIRDGFEAIVLAAADDLNLIAPLSPMEQAVTRLFHDSPFTSYQPEPKVIPVPAMLAWGPGGGGPAPAAPSPSAWELDWVQTAVLDHLEGTADVEWQVDPAQLARAIGVSQGVALKALDAVRALPPEFVSEEWPRLGRILHDEGELEMEGEATA